MRNLFLVPLCACWVVVDVQSEFYDLGVSGCRMELIHNPRNPFWMQSQRHLHTHTGYPLAIVFAHSPRQQKTLHWIHRCRRRRWLRGWLPLNGCHIFTLSLIVFYHVLYCSHVGNGMNVYRTIVSVPIRSVRKSFIERILPKNERRSFLSSIIW